MLAVVEHHEQLPVAQISRHRLLDGARRTVLDAQDLRHRVGHQRPAGEPGELDEPHAVRRVPKQPGGGFEREAGLATAARPGKRQQAMAAGEADDLPKLALAPDEARELERQVARPPHRRGISTEGRRGRPGRVLDTWTAGEDIPVKTAGLIVGLILEPAPQRLAQQVELPQRTLSAPAECIDAHELPMRPLVQRLIEKRLLERGDRGGAVAGLLVQAGEVDEQGEVPLPQRLPPHDRPPVKAILGQQLAAVEVERRSVAIDARLALGLRRSRLEHLHVDAEPIGKRA